MAMTATVCPQCGYDFPAVYSADPKSGWEYSAIAEAALMIGAFSSLMLAIWAAFNSVMKILSGSLLAGAMDAVQAVVLLALSVVFLRLKR